MRKYCLLLLLLAFLLPAAGAAGNAGLNLKGQKYSEGRLSSPALVSQCEHITPTFDLICAAAVPGITMQTGSHHLRSLPADSNAFQGFNETHRSFIFIAPVETFGNNQRNYNHPTHQFW